MNINIPPDVETITGLMSGLTLGVPKRARNSQFNRNSKKQKLIGFQIHGTQNPKPNEHGIYTYRISFNQSFLNEMRKESIHSTNIRRETAGVVYMIKGDIQRMSVGERGSVDNVPAVPASYHVHPGPAGGYPNWFTVPSVKDISVYLRSFPITQVNFVIDQSGIFVIDVPDVILRKDGHLSPSVESILSEYERILFDKSVGNRTDHSNSNQFLYHTGNVQDFVNTVKKRTKLNMNYIPYDTLDLSKFTIDINTVSVL